MSLKTAQEIGLKLYQIFETIEEILRNFEAIRTDKLSFIEEAEHLNQILNSEADTLVDSLARIDTADQKIEVQVRVVSQLKKLAQP